MNSFFREHFKGAMRYLCFFIRIVLAAIILSFVWYYDLYVAFRTKSSTLKQRYFVLYTSFIHILSRPYIIKRIGDDVSAFKELIRVYFFTFLANFVQSCMNMALKSRIELK